MQRILDFKPEEESVVVERLTTYVRQALEVQYPQLKSGRASGFAFDEATVVIKKPGEMPAPPSPLPRRPISSASKKPLSSRKKRPAPAASGLYPKWLPYLVIILCVLLTLIVLMLFAHRA